MKNSKIPKLLVQHLDGLYVVGGAIRDLLLNREPTEYDLITTSPLEKIPLRTFAPSNNGKTVGVYLKGMKYDITRYEDLQEDLERRDFTVNSMAVPVEMDGTLDLKKLVDPCKGKDDLRKKILRTFRAENLLQDPVRAIRGLRFVSQDGFNVETFTLAAMKEAMAKITLVAAERIFPPLEKFIHGKYFSKACEVAKKLNVERYLFIPHKNLDKAKHVDESCRWPVIFYNSSSFELFVKRVLPPNRVIRRVKRITYFASQVKKNDFSWTVKIKKDEVRCLIELLKVFNIPAEAVERYGKTELEISNSDLQEVGIVGKNIPKAMERIWKMVLTFEIPNERGELLKFAERLKKDQLDRE